MFNIFFEVIYFSLCNKISKHILIQMPASAFRNWVAYKKHAKHKVRVRCERGISRPQNNWSDIGHCPTHSLNCPTQTHNCRTKCPSAFFLIFNSHYILYICMCAYFHWESCCIMSIYNSKCSLNYNDSILYEIVIFMKLLCLWVIYSIRFSLTKKLGIYV